MAATIDIRVIPRAPRTHVDGERDGAILIRLTAAPVDGAANDALVAFLSEKLDVPRRDISVIAGEKSRHKRVRIANLAISTVLDRLMR